MGLAVCFLVGASAAGAFCPKSAALATSFTTAAVLVAGAGLDSVILAAGAFLVEAA